MSAKIELSLAPAKAKGLSEDERLDLGRLLLKAGYRVDIVRRRPNTNPGTNYDYFMVLDKGENNCLILGRTTIPAVRRTLHESGQRATSRGKKLV